jgi:hypothetical protein
MARPTVTRAKGKHLHSAATCLMAKQVSLKKSDIFVTGNSDTYVK